MNTNNNEKKPAVIHVAEVVRHGKQFIMPEGISLDTAIELLQRKKREEEEVVTVVEEIDAFVWDGALALTKAMAELFGYSHQEPTPGFFGPTPPAMVAVECGYNKTVMVPWGNFSLPGIAGRITTGTTRKNGIVVCQVVAEVKRKHKETIHAIVDLARKLAKDESIYKGQAVGIRWKDENGDLIKMPQPKFLDLSKVKADEVVFAEDVGKAITTSLFTPLEHSDQCRKLGIPLKRGILLSGKYGTGKTLVTYVTAAKATQNKWTFLHCQRADELAEMVKFAHKYQPAVIFCEDIDRSMSGGRTTEIDDILNIVDGIESKNTEVMVILTTNHLENINPAMLRPGRLDAIINVLPPDAGAVERLIRLYGRGLVPANADLSEVGKKMAGNIPAVIRECVERSKLAAIKLCPEGQLVITTEALLDAAASMTNQMDLLNKAAEPVSQHQKMVKVMGESLVRSLDAEFPDKA